ncbi:NmrA family NAD(P)-binding protein [Pelagibacterium mangrovi]|uniref:NmrA family NAD(P)-binding protein n=1 Tax=Pelagibacterium mangrovi TaxID=3119828 RepID=UPI002FCB52AA
MHVVFGASGRAGGETANALIERGHRVRVVVRRPEQGERWKQRGADVAIADFDDVATVVAALEGASAAFLLSPPPVSGDPYARAAKVSATLAEAADRASLPRAVLLSSIGAQLDQGTGVIATLHQFETALENAAPDVAFLRSSYFVETWEEVAQSAVADGVLPSFLPLDLKISMASTTDVGHAAAQLMSESWTGKRIVELFSLADWTATDVAHAFATALGRPVQAVFVPPEQRPALMEETGVPREVADALLGMYEGIESGRIAPEGGHETRHGTTTLEHAIGRIVADIRVAAQ